MSIEGQEAESFREVKSILVSQPAPADFAKSPYAALQNKYGIKIDFRSFIKVEGLDMKDFRKEKVSLADYNCVIFSSKHSIENYFRLCDEMRVKISEEAKYFCLTEQLALYLQHHIVYRKRKVFYGGNTMDELKPILLKNKKKEKFLVPCSSLGLKEVTDFLKEKDFNYTTAVMYNTVSADLSDLADITYDMLAFFSPQGPESLFENFPDFVQNNTRIAVFGKHTQQSALSKGLVVNVMAPSPECPSMTAAIEQYLKKSNPKPPQP